MWLIAHNEIVAQDGTYYLQMAKQWSSDPKGAMSDYVVHPGYPAAVVGTLWLMTGDSDSTDLDQWSRAGQAVSLVGGVLTVLAVWAFAGMVFGDWRIAFLAAMFFGLGRKFAALGAEVLSDTLMLCFAMWALAAALAAAGRLRHKSWGATGWAAGVGVLSGAAYLVRPEGLVVLPAAILLWALMKLVRRGRWSITLGAVAVAILAALVCVLPYMLTVGGLTAKWKMTEFGVGDAPVKVGTAPSVGHEPVYAVESSVAVRLIGRFFEAQQPILASLTCAYILLLAVSRLGKKTESLRRAVPPPTLGGGLMIVVGWVLVAFPIAFRYLATGAMSHRYLMLPAAMMVGFAPAALVSLVRLGGAALERKGPSRFTRFLLPGAAVVLSVILMVHTLRPLHTKQVFAKNAGLWLADRLQPEDALLADHFYVMYYSRARDGYVLEENSVRKRLARTPGLTRLKLLQNILESGRFFRFVAITGRETDVTTEKMASLLEGLGFVRVAVFSRVPAQGTKAKKTIYVYQKKQPTKGSDQIPTTVPAETL